jgi:hypothetical protein
LVFSKPNIPISSLDFDRKEGNSEIKEPHVEELDLVSTKKRVAIKEASELAFRTKR